MSLTNSRFGQGFSQSEKNSEDSSVSRGLGINRKIGARNGKGLGCSSSWNEAEKTNEQKRASMIGQPDRKFKN